jgi:hypothetical protein
MTEPTTEELVQLKKDGKTYREIGDQFGMHWEAVRSRIRRYHDRCEADNLASVEPEGEIDGVHPGDELPDEDEVYQAAVAEFERKKALAARKRAQTITFPYGPVAIAFPSDQHFVEYCNVPLAFDDAEKIANTPGMYAGLIGDMTDSMIIGRLKQARLDTHSAIPDEFALVRKYLRVIGPKTLFCVPGNHTNWLPLLTGIDYFSEICAQFAKKCLYDPHEIFVTLKIGEVEFPGKIRHKWRGRSIYNTTHGQERADKWPSEDYFVWSVGGHTHTGAFTRPYLTTLAEQGMAVQCGTYKENDPYARKQGFPAAGKGVPVVVFDEKTRSMTGFTCLDFAIQFMRRMYG